MGALILAIAASMCWGVGDYVGGSQTKLLPGILVVFLSQAVGLALVGAIVIAGGKNMAGSDLLAAAVAGVATGLGVTAFYKALAIGAMSVVAPISATGVIVPVGVGVADGDQLAGLQVVGIVFAIVGIGLASWSRDDDPGQRRSERVTIALAVLGALLIGISLAAFDRAATSGSFEAVFWARTASVSILGLICVVIRPDTEAVSRQIPALFSIGVLDVCGTLLYTTATGSGLLSVVAVAASLYPVSTIVLARVLLRERLPLVQGAGVVAALAGVVAIAAG